MWLINACQRRNWAYITPSYRLLPEAKGLDILSDAIDASFWVRKNLTERIILAGSSAGALLAFATAAHPRSSPPLCLLSIYGMLDLTAERYILPGSPLVGPPMDESRAIMQQMEEVAKQSMDTPSPKIQGRTRDLHGSMPCTKKQQFLTL